MKKRTFPKKFIRKEFILTKSISQEAEIVKGLKITKLDLSKMEKSKVSFDNQDIWIDDSEKIKETITGIWRGKSNDLSII
ncbi:hypothetical protein LCGC14_2106400 [marine sediment metagenome]|uniref:Uncharacterized protein n=1 Tax=marine sediment metagenome TaxID=412755 RepID=A0A0F9E3F0_9ZZZZ